jgi:hypothetical protein
MSSTRHLLVAIAIAGCSGQETVPGDDLGAAQLHVRAPLATEPDQQCMQIDAMRFSDFSHTGYLGPTNGARFNTREGDTRITAIAFGGNCNVPPPWDEAPWVADQLVVTLNRGRNDVLLTFRPNALVVVDTDFQDQPPLVATEELRADIGRNGEDVAFAGGHAYGLDGWDVVRLDLPAPGEGAGAGTQTPLFSTQGPPAGIPYSPRGLAATPGGLLVFAVGEPFQNVWAFTEAGAFVETWNILPRPPGMLDPDFTDGFDAIDEEHFVRTGLVQQGFNCDENGCAQNSLLEILEKVHNPDGSTSLQITEQIPLTGTDVLGVTAVGGRFAVSFIPFQEPGNLSLIEADGTVVANAEGASLEGLFHDPANGRIGAVSYGGSLTMFTDDTLVATGDTAHYPDALGANAPASIAWSSTTNEYIVLATTDDYHFTMASEDGATGSTVAADFSSILLPSSVEYLPGPQQIAVLDRFPPQDNVSLGPRITLYGAGGGAPVGTIILGGIARPFRSIGLGYIASIDELVSTHRTPGNPVNDAKFYRHDLAGNLTWVGDLGPWGMQRISSASWLPATDELIFLGVDTGGTPRWVVTDHSGNPHRSYRADGVIDGAPITSGPSFGKLGAVNGQPSELVRLSLP